MRTAWLAATATVLGACREAPAPAGVPSLPLTAVASASDLRIDPDGRLLGSLTGEGTAQGVHALSNDSAVMLGLLARARGRPADPLAVLRATGSVTLRPSEDGVRFGDAIVATPLGYTPGRIREVRLRAGTCGSGPIGELVIEAAGESDGAPPLLGPILVSLRTGDPSGLLSAGFVARTGPGLADSAVGPLHSTAERLMDSTLAALLPARWLPLAPTEPSAVQVNVLDDIDGVDIMAFWTSAEAIGYTVALRARRVAATGDTLLATASYTWTDGRPRPLIAASAFRLARGALSPIADALATGYARRPIALAGFGSSVDHVWFEYIDVAAGTTVWTVLAPESHTVTAAVTVAEDCAQ